jgi:hypothetical protein
MDVEELARTAAPWLTGPAWPDAEGVDAWRQIHHAAQIASEVGKAWAPPRDDDAHSSFQWCAGALVGATVPAPRPFRATLRVADRVLELAALDGSTLARRALAGSTLADSMAWVRREAERLAGAPARQRAVPAPDLPPHPVGAGAPFPESDRAPFERLSRLLAGADAVLRHVEAELPGAGPVRCWPHHFDLATLAAGVAGDPARTVGVGLATPDAIGARGYWYVAPWAPAPPPAGSDPPLSGGRWIPRPGSWPLAVLGVDEVSGLPGPGSRAARLAGFLVTAVAAACARLAS